jgi:hypothetical protein
MTGPADRTPNRPTALLESESGLAGALSELGIKWPRPVLVVVGGASGLDGSVSERLLVVFSTVAPLLDRLGALAVDGGTDCGVMALMGLARRRTGTRFPLLGVAAVGTVASPGSGTARLDPNHSHLLLVPGTRWGDESPWISRVATLVSGGLPSLALAAGGGEVTRLDIGEALAAGRPLAVLVGSGGTSDLLVRSMRDGAAPPVAGLEMGRPFSVLALDLDGAAETLPPLLDRMLGPGATG